ncbi:class I SAM-dependent methyltransferase [Glaciimonas soli]|uniref:Methyltransferase domain-containing protein n=1 Tax=Glaciimonas soli TaxID=2590999 RepID=A0A843YPE7_9BURK|nr:class I SAM-dependent methyltransferase [Glaciimonas soli]MQR00880.1 methyltransferase domain-containing protein [Glaciimonas soli]
MDTQTLQAYDAAAADYADDWHSQSAPVDLYETVARHFHPGLTADIGCGSGREVAWLVTHGFAAIGYDASNGLLQQAQARYPELTFMQASLPLLDGIADASFDNVLCETVIMHLDKEHIPAAVRRLTAVLKPGGMLYLSWRVTLNDDLRDPAGRLYTAFDSELIRQELSGCALLLDEELISASSGKIIHRVLAHKSK